jgi:hypothetical protein
MGSKGRAFSDLLSVFKAAPPGALGDATAIAAKNADAGRVAASVARTDANAAAAAVTMARNDPQALIRAVNDADDVVTNGQNLTRGSNARSGEATDLDAAGNPKSVSQLTDSAKSKLSILGVDITPMRVIGFSAFVTLVTLAAIYFSASANKTLNLTNIEMVDSTHLNISYTKPNSDFTLRINDELEFLAVTPAPTVPPLAPRTYKVTAVVSDTTIQITLPAAITSVAGQTVGGSASGTPGGPPAWATSWGQAKAHTTLENQFFGAVGDGVAFVAGAAAAAIHGATPALIQAIDDLGDIGGAASGALCKTVPFICNGTLLWIGGAIVLALIFFFVILPALSGGEKKNGE